MLKNISLWTTIELVKAKRLSTSPHELLRFFGLMFAMTLHDYGRRSNYWAFDSDECDHIFPAPAFGARFGMSRDRFENLLRYLRLSPQPAADDDDPWWPIRGFIDAINDRRVEKLRPSKVVVADESMSWWYSSKPDEMPDELPHTTKIIRKPRPVGAEIKNLADGILGIMLRLEIQEGKERMCHRDWAALPAGTAQLLRLCEPWFESRRIVCGDSAFASVTAAVELKKRGLFFQGLVKTASKEFPKKYLTDFDYDGRGGHTAATSEVDGVPLIAIGWQDKTLKQFVATCGTTEPGPPHRKRRYRNVDGVTSEAIWKLVKRPKIVADYFDAASKIDVHNHLRQGGLALESSWGTRKWHHRVLATLFGMIEVDSYLAYREFHSSGRSISHDEFTEKLCLMLLGNTYGQVVAPVTRSGPIVQSPVFHPVAPLTQLPIYSHKKGAAGGARRKCYVCVKIFGEKNNGHYYCVACSRADNNKIVALCGPQSFRGSRCIDYHKDHPNCEGNVYYTDE